jgi:CheY-like chemotaxis protein
MRILLADDNADSVEMLGVLLELEGHEVRTAADGQCAVELAIQHPPDVAILDIGMPRMDGYQAAQRIRQALPGVLLIALSAYSAAEHVRRGRQAGFNHHLAKPMQLAGLRPLLVS